MTRKMHRHLEMRLLHCPPAITIQQTDDLPYWLSELNSFAASNFVLTAKWRANPDFPMDFLDCTPFSSVSFLPFIKVIPAFAVASYLRMPSNQKFTGYRVRLLSLRYIFQKFFISLFCKTYFYFFTLLIRLKKI